MCLQNFYIDPCLIVIDITIQNHRFLFRPTTIIKYFEVLCLCVSIFYLCVCVCVCVCMSDLLPQPSKHKQKKYKYLRISFDFLFFVCTHQKKKITKNKKKIRSENIFYNPAINAKHSNKICINLNSNVLI